MKWEKFKEEYGIVEEPGMTEEEDLEEMEDLVGDEEEGLDR
jgi:hypothetical protein